MSQLYDLNFLNKTTTIKVQADAGAKTIDVTATSGMSAEESISIVLDDASTHIDTITEITDADTLKIKSGIPVGRHADVGAVVKTYYSFMLLQDGRKKGFRVTDAPLLPQTLITETASPSSIAPEREIQLSQVDWRKGIQDFLLSDHYRYFDSENCDGRFKGRVMLSPKKLTSLSFGTQPTAPTLTDGALDSWSDANTLTVANWTRTGDMIVQNNSVRHTASGYSAQLVGTAPKSATITQTVFGAGTLPAYCKGNLFTASVWVRGGSVNCVATITISDGVGTSVSIDAITSADTWQQATVSRRLDGAATQLVIIITFTSATSNNCYVDDAALTCTAYAFGAVVDQVEFGDDIVVAMGNCLFNIVSGAAVQIATFPQTITVLCVYQNRLYIAQGWGYPYYYTSDLITFTASTLLGGETAKTSATTADATAAATSIAVVSGAVYGATPFYARWENEIIWVTTIVTNTLTVIVRGQLGSTAAAHLSGTSITELATVTGAKFFSNVGDTQFWICDTNSTMRDSDNPINDGTPFSSAYQVGSDSFDITGLVDHPEIVFVRKQDQVYYLSMDEVIPLLPISTEANTTYVYGLHVWGDFLFVPSGINSMYLYEISTGVATVISPTRYAIGDANYDGQVLAMCHDETYLYAVLDNGSDIRVLAGRFENVEGDTDWYWHPVYSKTSNNITCMLVSSLSGSKRLYMGTDTYTDGILLFKVSTSYSGVWLESGMEFELTGNFYVPWLTSNFPTDVKLWKSVAVTSICVTGVTSIAVYYKVKGGDWVSLGTCSTSAWVTGYPAEKTDTFTIGVESERIEFKFVLTTTDDDYTPMIYGGGGGGYVAYGVLLAERERQIEGIIQVAPVIRLRDYVTVVARTVSNDLLVLRALYKAKADETVVALDGTEYIVVFAREGYEEQAAFDEIMRNEQWWVTVRLLET